MRGSADRAEELGSAGKSSQNGFSGQYRTDRLLRKGLFGQHGQASQDSLADTGQIDISGTTLLVDAEQADISGMALLSNVEQTDISGVAPSADVEQADILGTAHQ